MWQSVCEGWFMAGRAVGIRRPVGLILRNLEVPGTTMAFGRVDAMPATIANYVGDLEQSLPVGLGRSLRCTIGRFERTS